MTRQHKFRVYIPDLKTYEYFTLGDFNLADRYLRQHLYPVQSFTGLLDKEGQEIYEGDILENENKRTFEVVWNEGGFFEIRDGEYLWEVASKMKVVGYTTRGLDKTTTWIKN